MYNYTGYQYRYIDGSETIFQEFLEGRLDSASVPSSRVTEFINDPRVQVAPAATTWRLMINGFGTEDARDEYIAQYPNMGLDDTFVPEPILMYTEMRLAFQYGFDRYHAAVEVVQTYLPAFDHFSETYFLDGESGIGVRGSEAGQAIMDDFGGESYGYFPDAAVDLFKDAVAKAIADGYYTAGTADNYTTIELSLTYASSGNTGAQGMVAQLEEQYEALLVDDVNFVNIDIVVADVEFPYNYYNYMMVAATDLGIGGISGSLLDAPSFLDVYNDDNISGFTLNWGIDTHTPNIDVIYANLEGEYVAETWGYNALVAALNNKIYIKDGEEQTAFADADTLINAYVDMAGDTVASTSDGSVLAQYLLGDTVENIATDEELDSLTAVVVVTDGGSESLYVISELDGDFELYTQSALFKDVETLLNSVYPVATVNGQLDTDAALAADAYLGGAYATLAELAADLSAPLEYMEAWDVTWGGSYGGRDVYVLLHIGDYYLPWEWL
jgi:hypothetical protein